MNEDITYVTDIKRVEKAKNIVITDDKCSIQELCDFLENLNENVRILKMPYEKEVAFELKKRHTYQGFNRSILNKVKQICELNVNDDDIVVDMTVGNGFDSLFLGKLVSNGFLFGFDIQKAAIFNTTKVLEENNIKNYKLFLTSHDQINTVLNDYKGKIKLVLFNLGYLPGGNKKITTNHSTTLKAFINSYELLSKNGLILIVFYPHEEGVLERKSILNYLNKNNIMYNEFHNTNNKQAPFLIEIKKET